MESNTYRYTKCHRDIFFIFFFGGSGICVCTITFMVFHWINTLNLLILPQRPFHQRYMVLLHYRKAKVDDRGVFEDTWDIAKMLIMMLTQANQLKRTFKSMQLWLLRHPVSENAQLWNVKLVFFCEAFINISVGFYKILEYKRVIGKWQ